MRVKRYRISDAKLIWVIMGFIGKYHKYWV